MHPEYEDRTAPRCGIGWRGRSVAHLITGEPSCGAHCASLSEVAPRDRPACMRPIARLTAFPEDRTAPGETARGAILLVAATAPGATVSLLRAIAERLQHRYDIVALLLAANDEVKGAFEEFCQVVVGPLTDRSYRDAKDALTALLSVHAIDYAIVGGASAAAVSRALIDEFVPVVSVVTGFEADKALDLEAIDTLDWSTTVVFTDAAAADAARLAHPPLASRKLYVVPYPTPELAELSATRRLTARGSAQVDDFARRIDEIGQEAVAAMLQRARDFATLRDSPIFDASVFLPPETILASREEAIVAFLARWNAAGGNRRVGNFFLRRPCAGFHPQIYANEFANRYDTTTINPLAHLIRSGLPKGPWHHEIITPAVAKSMPESLSLQVAVHAHFYYPELAVDFLRRLSLNRLRSDLFLTTDSEVKADFLRDAALAYRQGRVTIRLVPNRGRDWGAFLTGILPEIDPDYDIVGHLHGKRSPHSSVGDPWREFMWEHLLGSRHSMGDLIAGRFAADARLGLVFADDPHLPDWDGNLDVASRLVRQMGFEATLPPYIDFPVGSMFWARVAALRPLTKLRLAWEDYPDEPVPNDGSLLHALERLVPFVVAKAGYRFATTSVPGITWNGAVGTDHDATCDRTRR